MTQLSTRDLGALKRRFQEHARALGFNALGVAGVEIPEDEAHLIRWLADGFHGEMGFMARHGLKRSRAQEFKPGTVRVLSVRMDYWPAQARPAQEVLSDASLGYVSRYALGRDYHPSAPGAAARLATQLQAHAGAATAIVLCVPTPRRFWSAPMRAMRAWAGSASTAT